MRRSGPGTSSPCPRWSSDGRISLTLTDRHRRGARRAAGARLHRARTDRGASGGDRRAEPAAERLHHGDRRARAGAGRRGGRGTGARRVRAAHRHSAGDQGPVLHRGRAHHRRQPDPRAVRAAVRKHRQRQSAARRRGVPRQGEHGRVRHGFVEHDLGLRPGGEPVEAAAGRRRRAGAGRLVGRFGGGGVGAAGDGRDRDRYRRLDPPAGSRSAASSG